MNYPEFFNNFPSLDVPFPEDQVTIRAIRSDQGLAVFFDFHKDTVLPPHSHKGQWGTVIEGEVEITIDGVARSYHPGESYFMDAGVVHGVRIKAGTKAVDVFEEPDRYPLKP